MYPSQSTALTDMGGLARTAKEIDVLAVRGLGILGLNDSVLRTSVQHGAPTVRALLLDQTATPPNGAPPRSTRAGRVSRPVSGSLSSGFAS